MNKPNLLRSMSFKGGNTNPYYVARGSKQSVNTEYPIIELALASMTEFHDAVLVINQIKNRTP